jgi:hypothetical protein
MDEIENVVGYVYGREEKRVNYNGNDTTIKQHNQAKYA